MDYKISNIYFNYRMVFNMHNYYTIFFIRSFMCVLELGLSTFGINNPLGKERK